MTGGKQTKHVRAAMICTIALAIVINYIGGQLALLFRLPIYLDSIGTILTACLFGPLWGMVPPLLSGIIMSFTGDIYSLYFAPVGMILGLMTGFVMRKGNHGRARIFLDALIVTIPGTIVSSLINAAVFGGVTSSGSSLLVQVLAHTPLGLTGSIFVVQILTDYLDRLISLFLVQAVLRVPAVRA
ncbi:MAG: ECF transporter S component [Lachnospiraceae bacterium]|jgi:energy-coupling factor transport system substrate-specific component